jgi:hypothetical protein
MVGSDESWGASSGGRIAVRERPPAASRVEPTAPAASKGKRQSFLKAKFGSDSKSEPKSKAKSEAKPKAKTKAQAKPEPVPTSPTRAESKSRPKAKRESFLKAKFGSDSKSAPKTEAEHQSRSKSKSESKSHTKEKRSRLVPVAAAVVILIVGAGAVLKLEHPNAPASAAASVTSYSLAVKTASTIGSPCNIVPNLSPRQKELSAVSIENPTMSSKVTGQTVCVSGHYELTSITLAPGTKSQGEIVKSAAHAAPFALVYGPSWVVAVTGEKMPHASAGRYSLADFAHTIGGTTWTAVDASTK